VASNMEPTTLLSRLRGRLKWYLGFSVAMLLAAGVRGLLGIDEPPTKQAVRIGAESNENRLPQWRTQGAEALVAALSSRTPLITGSEIAHRQLKLTIGSPTPELAWGLASRICTSQSRLHGWTIVVALLDGTPAARCIVSASDPVWDSVERTLSKEQLDELERGQPVSPSSRSEDTPK